MGGIEDGAEFASRREERRTHPRYPVDEESLLVLVHCGLPMKARIVELSLEACRIRTCEQFTGNPGQRVEACFKVKGFTFRFGGVVRWTNGRNLVGIHFENVIQRRKTDLTEVIDEIAASAPEPAESSRQQDAGIAPPVPAKNPRATGPKLLEMKAVKTIEPPAAPKANEPVVHASVAEAGPQAAIESQAHPSASPRDRRGQPRHKVDTFATILLVKVGSALRGRIADLSLSGCRVCTEDRFPVGIYTRVETEFHLQGLPFRLGGVIQAIYNRNTVGIRFLDLSDRKRQQVLELIDEIAETLAATPPPESSLPESSQASHL
ncbi:MAG: PilZ domain-containing protein [Terracidiphilus sp.]